MKFTEKISCDSIQKTFWLVKPIIVNNADRLVKITYTNTNKNDDKDYQELIINCNLISTGI